MNTKQITNILTEVRKSSTFLSINNYKSSNGEVANYEILFNVSYKNAVLKSITMLQAMNPKSKIDKQAKIEILNSLNDSLAKMPTEDDVLDTTKYNYIYKDANLVKGLKTNIKTNQLHISGMIHNKTVITDGNVKQVSSSKLTLAKEKIKDQLPISKYRTFIFTADKADSISVERMTIMAPTK